MNDDPGGAVPSPHDRLLIEAAAVFARSVDPARTVRTIAELLVDEVADHSLVFLSDPSEGPVLVEVASRAGLAPVGGLPSKAESPEHWQPIARVIAGSEAWQMLSPPPCGLSSLCCAPDDMACSASSVLVLVPMRRGNEPIGALGLVYRDRGRAPVGRACEVLCRLADLTAEALGNERLFQAMRRAIAMRQEVMGMVAHDLRGPLGMIAWGLHEIRAHLLDEGEQGLAELSEAMEESIGRMVTLVGDLLDVNRLESGHLSLQTTSMPVDEVVGIVRSEIRQRTVEAGIDLVVRCRADGLKVEADPARLVQVLVNLLTNAIQASSAGSEVWLDIDGGAAHEGGVCFSVIDHGCGIDPGRMDDIFDRFAREGSKDRRGGNGLGLTIVRGIVEAHGGRVRMESEVGRGTSCHVWLPGAALAPVAGAPQTLRTTEVFVAS